MVLPEADNDDNYDLNNNLKNNLNNNLNNNFNNNLNNNLNNSLNNDLDADLRGQGDEDSLMDNHIGDCHSKITDKDGLEMATPNWLMLQMLFKHWALRKVEQRPKQERIAAKQDQGAT